MRAPAPSFTRTLLSAAGVAAFWAVVLSLAYGVLVVLSALLHSGRGTLAIPALAASAARLAATLFIVIFLVAAVFRQRTWQDRAFAVVGLMTTFFGLAILLFFFARLADDVTVYFNVMPVLIEQRNREIATEVERAEHRFKTKMAEVRHEMDTELARARTADEKKEIKEFFEKEVMPNTIKDLKATAEEARFDLEHSLRPDAGTLALVRHFLFHGPSNEPQDVGIFPALLGSLWIAAITILFAVPVGVGAALYLEEYRRNNWLGQIIQVNINNLAGIPSVVYGILGGFVFVELIFKPLATWHPGIAPRNVLGGGLTLGLLTLPVIIVSAQESIRAVPRSIREGAYALGATRWQVTWHQVLPMAKPGILTGTILALSRAIGEAAPLVLFGALQFVDQQPSLLSRFTVLPLQIFGWSDRPPIEVPGYAEPVNVGHSIAALASVLLLVVLLSLNALAIYLRNRAQQRVRG
jgi:phosphate transport system permease protein